MKHNKNEKSPYATLDIKPVSAPKGKQKKEPKSAKITSGGDLRAKGGR